MDHSITTNQNTGIRRPAAWLIVLAGIPVLIVLTIVWCQLCTRVLSLIKLHLSGFWENLFDDFVGELGVTTIATAVIMYLCGSRFAERAEKLIATRHGWRYIAAAACSLALAVLLLAHSLWG